MTEGSAPHLFCFGLGYSAETLVGVLRAEGWTVSGTSREPARVEQLRASGLRAFRFDRDHPLDDAAGVLADVTDILSSVPPDEHGDAVLDLHAADIVAAKALRWVGYLSTTGVYGSTEGQVVAEDAPLAPSSERGQRRVVAEQSWLDLWKIHGVPAHVFRLAGIYGPGRSVLDQIRAGTAKRIDRPGHVFSRIHVDDIARVLHASMANPDVGAVYNVTDDEAVEPSTVVAFASSLLGLEPPAMVSLDVTAEDMSPMARSFWNDNRRVDNSRIKRDLGIQLRYPNYRAGLAAVLQAEAEMDAEG